MAKKTDIPIKLTVDTSALEKADNAAAKFPEAISTKINVDDGEVTTATRLVSDLDSETADVKISVTDTELDDVQEQLETLNTLATIDLSIVVGGMAIEGVKSVLGFGVADVLEIDSAMAILEARTGRMIPDADELINDIYTDGWGESRTQIAEVIALATQLGVEQDNLKNATETAFTVAAVTGGDVNEVLGAMDTLVKSGLVPSYEAAGDVMVTGFQSGLDKQGDLTDSLTEYATKLSSMGITAEGTLAILKSGMQAGVMNTDFLSDSIREFGIRLSDIGTDENIANAFEQLDSLTDIDLAANLDAYNAGLLSGDDFLQGMFDAVAEANTKDPEAANNAVEQLFGTQAEDLGAEVWGKLSTDADTFFGDIEGRASEAGTAISSSLTSTIDTGMREIEQVVVDFLSSDAIDLPGKIDDIQAAIGEGLAEISAGGTLGDALEVALNVPGLADTLNTFMANFERVVGNIVIEFLSVIATVQEIAGKDSTGTRAEISRLGQTQLAFDLQIANEGELQGLIEQSLVRGVDPTAVSESLQTAVNEAIGEGEFERALNIQQALVDTITAQGGDATAAQAAMDNLVSLLDTQFKVSMANGDFDLASAIADAQGDSTRFDDAMKAVFGFDAASFDSMIADSMAAMTTNIETETATPFEKWAADAAEWANQGTAIDEATQAALDAQSAMNGITATAEDVTEAAENANLQNLVDWFVASGDAAVVMDDTVTNAMTGNTVTASIEAVQTAADTHFPVVIKWFDTATEKVMDFDVAAQRLPMIGNFLASLAAGVDKFPYDKLQSIVNLANGFAGAGNIVTNNDTTVNVNQTNNVSNNAQSQATTYQIAQAVGGG